jgi:hypothetical protein
MDELKNIKSDISFIPEGCLDYVEESTYIVAAIDEEFDYLMESCGLSETNTPAGESAPEDKEADENVATSESAEVVTEAEKINIKEKLVSALQFVWRSIKGAFDKVVEWIKDRVAEANQKGLAAALKRWDKATFKSDKMLGKYHVAAHIADTTYLGALKTLIVGSSNRAYGDDPVNMPTNILKAMNVDGVSDGTNVSTMRAKLKEHFLGKDDEKNYITVTGANVGSVKADIERILKGDQLNAVKKVYNETRKSVNEAITAVKQQAAPPKDENGKKQEDTRSEDTKKRLAGNVNSVKRYGQLLATVVGVQLECIRQQNREAFGIAFKVATKINVKAKNEAAEVEAQPKFEAADIFAW